MPTDEQQSALIELTRVDVDIDGTPILHAIDWRLVPRQHWGIIGANGSGKSTLLALIGGVRWPAPGRGTRWYDFGHGPQSDAVKAKQHIASVGPALQDRYAAWGWNFTALEVVLSGVFRTDVPRNAPTTRDTLRARALLRDLDLSHLGERRFLELSRGQQRRVLIARALAFQPRVLLLDEPASGLDHDARQDLHRLLERVAEQTQLVVTTHAFERLPPDTTHILELAAGRIVACTEKQRYLQDHQDVASDPTNLGPRATNVAWLHGQQTALDTPVSGAPEPLISVRNADVWLGGQRVLHAINWRLTVGAHWLVTGHNGAGKSSFLRLLHGQLRPAVGGEIHWPALGDPDNVWLLRRAVAWFAPELQAAYRYRTSVYDCIASGFDSSLGRVRVLTEHEQARVEMLLDRFELNALRDRLVATLSYGQFRRALLARVLAPKPRVLLLDEPWEGLDPATRDLIGERLAETVTEGAQLVCASHVEVMSGHWTHELVLEKGQIATTS